MTSIQFTVSVKPSDHKGDTEYIQVSPADARRIQQEWDEHKNVRIGERVVSWQRIVEIVGPPRTDLLTTPKWCGSCENGWLFGSEGAYACSCNASGAEAVREYAEKISNNLPYQALVDDWNAEGMYGDTPAYRAAQERKNYIPHQVTTDMNDSLTIPHEH